jgi:hypothetical protein
MLISRRISVVQNSKTEVQLMLDKMRARQNGTVAMEIIPEKSGELHY